MSITDVKLSIRSAGLAGEKAEEISVLQGVVNGDMYKASKSRVQNSFLCTGLTRLTFLLSNA